MSYILFAVLAALYFTSCHGNTCAPVKADDSASSGRGKRWAIVALARPGKTDIVQRNKQLAAKLKPYADKHNITVLMFSEKAFPASALQSWRSAFAGVAKVQLINTADRGFSGPERFGYKYMCKFFSLDLYDYLREYDYYMRCDTDCYLTTLNYDILAWAEEHNVGYGFAMRKLEAHKPTRETLPAWSNTYTTQCGITPSAPMDAPMSTCFNFYNNWHIGSVSFFNRPDVRHFLQAVNASGHILSHRWGDSTIQAYAVRIFMQSSQIVQVSTAAKVSLTRTTHSRPPPTNFPMSYYHLQVPDFKYVHGSHGNKVISTFGDGSQTKVPQRLPNWKYKET
jgi:hypothetical protein